MDDDFREWQPDVWFDKGFLQWVPAPVRNDFMRSVRPLNAELHEGVHQSLFAGIKQPFHYRHATGWMGRLIRQQKCELPQISSPDQRASYLREKLRWPAGDVVLLVYQEPTTYATTWDRFLHYFRQDYLFLDTMLVCHPQKREVILFWEDYGPFLGKRGHRKLRCPRWVHEKIEQADSI